MTLSIRPAARADLPLIAQFIRDLADYERLSGEVRFDIDMLGDRLFGPRPYAEVLIGEIGGVPQGFALFFTGLSGAGKSTIAQAVIARLLENSARSITLLDGDEVRTHLSRGLGFSREDRAANVSRIGYVASEIVRHGGIAVCAPIAPYRDVRAEVRARVESFGSFIEIHVDTELATCEARDRKGLYAQARAGKIPHFTGISDPYEAPLNPELRLNGAGGDPASLATQVVALLRNRGLIEPATPA